MKAIYLSKNYLRDKVQDERPNFSFMSIVDNQAKGGNDISCSPAIKNDMNSTPLANDLKVKCLRGEQVDLITGVPSMP